MHYVIRGESKGWRSTEELITEAVRKGFSKEVIQGLAHKGLAEVEDMGNGDRGKKRIKSY